MLEFYLISTVSCFGISCVTDKMLKERCLNDGYIPKAPKSSKAKFIINLVLAFTPFVNILKTLFTVVGATIALKNDELFRSVMRSAMYSPEKVKRIYEMGKTDTKSITDAMVLEGANETVIKQELEQINVEKEKYSTSFTGVTFNEKDYDLAQALSYANQFLLEIEFNIELTAEEKREILSELRKVYLDEIKGLENTNMKPINKLEKIIAKRLY